MSNFGADVLRSLQPRERTLVMMLAGVFFVIGIAVLGMVRKQRFEAKQQEITDLRQAIDLVHTQGAVYQEKLASKSKSAIKLSDQPVLFSTLIEAAEAETGVSAGNQEVQAAVGLSETVRVRAVTFDLRNTTLEQAMRFLTKLEGDEERVILTRSLLIRSPSGAEDRLNIDIEMATWERMGGTSAEAIGGVP